MSEVICRICGKNFDRIPPDAIQIGRGGVSPLYRFVNGEVHALGSVKLGRSKTSRPNLEERRDE